MHEGNRFSSKTHGKSLFHFQNDRCGRPVLTLESALSKRPPSIASMTEFPLVLFKFRHQPYMWGERVGCQFSPLLRVLRFSHFLKTSSYKFQFDQGSQMKNYYVVVLPLNPQLFMLFKILQDIFERHYSLKPFFFFSVQCVNCQVVVVVVCSEDTIKLYFLARQSREGINPFTTAALLLFETNTFFFQHFCQLCKSR